MIQRINPYNGYKAVKSLFTLGAYERRSSIDQSLANLICYRISLINGCAFCIDMHSKDLLAAGENAQRIFVMNAWRESSLFSDRERVALNFAEAVNALGQHGVPDEVFENAKQYFTEEELIDLTVAVIAVSSYNRINIAFRVQAGNYQPGQYATLVS